MSGILKASDEGKFDEVKRLVVSDADVNERDEYNNTGLHFAASGDLLEIVIYLVEHGADVNCENNRSDRPLHFAIKRNSLEMVGYLVKHGADINCKNKENETALHHAVYYSFAEISKYLVENGASINSKNERNEMALHYAVKYGSLEMVKYLVENGAKVVSEEHHGKDTVLFWACTKGNEFIIDYLLQHGAKKSIKHREKIQSLEAMDQRMLTQIGTPLKYFSADNAAMSLGKGAMGTSVYVGIMEDGSEVAVKRMLIQSCKNFAENEKKIFSLIETNKSPFIVSYRSFFKDSIFMYLIVDLCEETLEDYVESQSIEHFREHGPRMIKEILHGLDALHDQGILHRDLKPSNILVDVEGHMRLADFGISRVFNEDESTIQTKVRGTRKWMPTEVIKSINEEIEGRYKRKSDVQTAGMIAFFILSKGKHPFGTHMYDCMANIAEGNPVNLDILEDLEARHFVSWLIRHNINDRPYACDALEHRFMVQVPIYEELLKQALKTDG